VIGESRTCLIIGCPDASRTAWTGCHGVTGSADPSLRALTDAEAKVLSLLLANTATDERERLRQSGLPRSTYHAARRRAYAEGWLKDRYVPSPTLLRFGETTISLARPFADKSGELAERWGREPGNVLNWMSNQFGLAVFFHRDRKSREAAASRLVDAGLATETMLLHPKLEEHGVPVYFDFEGVWSHLTSTSGTRAYPRGLPPLPEGFRADSPSPWNPRTRWAARELLLRPFEAESQGRAGHLVGPFGLPFAQQRLLGQGWVLHRVLADPARVPGYRGRLMDRVVLIAGELQDGITPDQLFATLTRECRVYPFLYAMDERRVLLGALGQTASAGVDRVTETERRSVLPTLRQALRGIQILEESAPNIRVSVDHRYDRLTPPD
jgi:hypothetical protein